MKKSVKLFTTCLLAGWSHWLLAEEAEKRPWSPYMLGFSTESTLPSKNHDVYGIRLSLLGAECYDFTGIDIGLGVSYINGHGRGVQLSPINIANTFSGLQLGLGNYCRGNMAGIQIGVVNCAYPMTGVQIGFINISDADGVLLQIRIINWGSEKPLVQIGLFNSEGFFNFNNREPKGFQIPFLFRVNF